MNRTRAIGPAYPITRHTFQGSLAGAARHIAELNDAGVLVAHDPIVPQPDGTWTMRYAVRVLPDSAVPAFPRARVILASIAAALAVMVTLAVILWAFLPWIVLAAAGTAGAAAVLTRRRGHAVTETVVMVRTRTRSGR